MTDLFFCLGALQNARLNICTVQPLFYSLEDLLLRISLRSAKKLAPCALAIFVVKKLKLAIAEGRRGPCFLKYEIATHLSVCRSRTAVISSPLTNRCSFINSSSSSSRSRPSCSVRSFVRCSDLGSVQSPRPQSRLRHLSRRTAAALMNGSEEERQTKLEIRLGGRTDGRTDGPTDRHHYTVPRVVIDGG